jgi:hypothetical protein
MISTLRRSQRSRLESGTQFASHALNMLAEMSSSTKIRRSCLALHRPLQPPSALFLFLNASSTLWLAITSRVCTGLLRT